MKISTQKLLEIKLSQTLPFNCKQIKQKYQANRLRSDYEQI